MTTVKSMSLMAIIATVLVLAGFVDARAAEKKPSNDLLAVMEQMGRNMQEVTGAISREDWALVVELAPGIARHPQPSALDKVRILKWVGTDVGKFRDYDAQVERTADEMAAAAARGDGAEVIRAFSEVQQACLACHQQFRKRYVEHFHGER